MQEQNRDADEDEDDSKRDRPRKTTGLDADEGVTEDADSPLPNIISSPNLTTTPGGNTSLCSTSTIATMLATPMTSVVASPYGTTLIKSNDEEGSTTLKVQRRSLTRDALFMFLLSAISFGAFLYFYLPVTALIALGMFAVTNCLGFYFLYERVIMEYNNLLHGRGIGDYLPQSLYVQLAETSLHEWMMDSSFFNEYRYLLLYYMPGITTEELEELISRLPPRRREVLQRRGLGHMFGDGFMRLIMGDSRWQPPPENAPILLETEQSADTAVVPVSRTRALQIVQDDDTNENAESSPPLHSITARPLRRRLYDGSEGDTSDIGLDSPSEPAPSEQEQPDLSSDWWEEGQIITDAFISMAQSYSLSMFSFGQQTLRQVSVTAVDYLSTALIAVGIGTTSISTGVGLLGVWYGAYYPWRDTQSSSRFPAGRVLLSSAFAGGVSAGVMLMIRGAIRRKTLPQEESDPDEAESDEQRKKES